MFIDIIACEYKFKTKDKCYLYKNTLFYPFIVHFKSETDYSSYTSIYDSNPILNKIISTPLFCELI